MEFSFFKVIFILLGALLADRIVRNIVVKLVCRTLNLNHGLGKIDKERVETLSQVFSKTAGISVWILAFLMILPEMGINISALLAGIGVVGLAIGMGAKKIIEDFIAGLFIILEDHYRVGDQVDLAGVSGKVVDLNFRTTVLKDSKGKTYIIPNNEISISSKTKKK